ncbi:MAG: DNA polymerase ligase N-terminal domain-containing protein [Chthoniobacterales bacterium]
MHDVLKSWAVPHGVPLKLGEVHSAFKTEDHPIAYLDFEGIIPQGEYGGGTVMVWDIGTSIWWRVTIGKARSPFS